jgi:hypothetical protein
MAGILKLDLCRNNAFYMKLYVDYFDRDSCIAVAVQRKTLQYNLGILNHLDGNNSHVLAVGRYICIFSVNNEACQMLFMDMRINHSTIREIIESLEPEQDLKRKFISLLEVYNLGYENNFDSVQLVKVRAQ